MKKKIKLLFLVHNLKAFCSHRLPIAEASKIKGFDVVIGYGELGGSDPKLLEQKGLKVKFIPMQRGGLNLLKDLKTLYYIYIFFKKFKPDIVHLVSIKPYLYGGIISRITRVKCLVSAVSGLGPLFIHKNFKNRFLLLLIYPIFRLAFNHLNQKIIVQNKDDKNTLISWGVLNPLNVRLIKGSGVKLENFVDFSENNIIPVVCFASRFLVDKGIYDFVSAAKLLHKRGVQAQFILAGDLDEQSPSGINSNDLEKLKKNKYIKILEYQKNIPTLYARSHIICLPSYREGLPKALIEAAAANRAVVTTDVPGCRDVIIPGKTGLLVPLKDPQKLADALQWLIENPQRRREMGNAGRQLAESQFGIEKIVKDHLNIYYKLLDNK